MMPHPLSAHPNQGGKLLGSQGKQIVVGMGDMVVSRDPDSILVTYSLGSCVGITVYDPVIQVGGLLHAMLPNAEINPERARSRPYMFVDTGLPALFHSVYSFGGFKSRLVVKLVGGAEFLDEQKLFKIGHRNVETSLHLLSRNGVPLKAQDTGGRESRTVRLHLSDGGLSIDSPGKQVARL